jgi:pyrimidine-nucleoside phosphorylase
MDIKVGRGAFMNTLERARELGRSIVRVGRAAGLPVSVLFTAMDAPLGRAVGNALETREAFEVLAGGGPDDVIECSMALGAQMLRRGGIARSEASARRMLHEALQSRRALAIMQTVVRSQGGDPRVVSEPDRLPRAPRKIALVAKRDGWVRSLDALAIGRACSELGAGRARSQDSIDPRVGVVLCRKPGERVRVGETLAEVHAADRASAQRAIASISEAYAIGTHRRASPLILGSLG